MALIVALNSRPSSARERGSRVVLRARLNMAVGARKLFRLPLVDPRVVALRERIAHLPSVPGLICSRIRGGLCWRGRKVADLRSRVSSYFQDSADLLSCAGRRLPGWSHLVIIDFLECETEVEALLTENRLIKDIQPRFNARLMDDKTFPYLEITTREDYPGVYVTRQPRIKGSKLYGPFTSAGAAGGGARNCSGCSSSARASWRFGRMTRSGGSSGRACCMRSSSAPRRARTRSRRRRTGEDIERLKKFLDVEGAARCCAEMTAGDGGGGDGAGVRGGGGAARSDQGDAGAVERSGGRRDEEMCSRRCFISDPQAGLQRLQEMLELEPSRRASIEGIDIAHLQGEATVGSLVCFIDGRPFKNGYRRFRIKTVEGMDDYAIDPRGGVAAVSAMRGRSERAVSGRDSDRRRAGAACTRRRRRSRRWT